MQRFEIVDSHVPASELVERVANLTASVYEARRLQETERGLQSVVAMGVHYEYDSLLQLRPTKVIVKEGRDGAALASMDQNFAQTKFAIHGASGDAIAELEFSWFSLKKGFGLRLGARELEVEMHTATEYRGVDEEGRTQLIITADKNVLSADRWEVACAEDFPGAVAVLSVVSLRLRRE